MEQQQLNVLKHTFLSGAHAVFDTFRGIIDLRHICLYNFLNIHYMFLN